MKWHVFAYISTPGSSSNPIYIRIYSSFYLCAYAYISLYIISRLRLHHIAHMDPISVLFPDDPRPDSVDPVDRHVASRPQMPHARWSDELWSWWLWIRSSASRCHINYAHVYVHLRFQKKTELCMHLALWHGRWQLACATGSLCFTLKP